MKVLTDLRNRNDINNYPYNCRGSYSLAFHLKCFKILIISDMLMLFKNILYTVNSLLGFLDRLQFQITLNYFLDVFREIDIA